jgi:hypothetical protein
MTTDYFCFYFQNRLIQTSQTGGQRNSDTSPFSIPFIYVLAYYSYHTLRKRGGWLEYHPKVDIRNYYGGVTYLMIG